MKRLIIIVAVLIFAMPSKGQAFIGVSAGSNLSSMSIFLRDRSTFRIKPLFGYNANLIFEYKFKQNYSIRTGISVTQKGFNQHIKYFYSPLIDSVANIQTKLTYLEIPIFLKFNTNLKKINLFYGFGPYIGYGIHGSIDTDITGRNNVSNSETMKWNKRYTYSDLINEYGYARLRRFDSGVGTMLGVKFKNFTAYASYKFGLVNEMWEFFQDEKMSNSSLSLSIGYLFNGQKQSEIKN